VKPGTLEHGNFLKSCVFWGLLGAGHQQTGMPVYSFIPTYLYLLVTTPTRAKHQQGRNAVAKPGKDAIV